MVGTIKICHEILRKKEIWKTNPTYPDISRVGL